MSFPLGPEVGPGPPKQFGAYGGLYDKPIYRDWLSYWTIGWTVFAGLAIAFPTKASAPTTSMPTWLNALLAALFFGALLGVLPAYIRLLIRRRRLRSARPSAEQAATTSVPPPSSSQRGDASRLRDQPQRVDADPPRATRPHEPASPEGRPGTRRADSPATAPINVLDLSAVRNSEVLTRARRTFPYPIARGVRLIQSTTDQKDTYDAALRTAEMISIVLGITATTWARSNGISTHALAELHRALLSRGVSQGQWQQAMASIKRPMQDATDAVPGMVDALRSRRGEPGLLVDLGELVEERNRWAHGSGPQNRVEAAERLSEIFPPLERCLERITFLAESPWILVRHLQMRRREGDFLVQASRAMGDHPDFQHFSFATGQALAEEVFYLRTGTALLDMTPLVVLRPCPTCHQPEVAYADRLDERKGVSLKTFDRGHHFFDVTLAEEIRDLMAGAALGDEDRASS